MKKSHLKEEIRKLEKKASKLPTLDIKTETKLRAFANLLIDRVIEDRANGYYIDKKGIRRKRRTSAR